MKNKLYILTDKTLDPIYASVQGGHVVAQWLIEFGLDSWNNDYLIYLSVDIKEWYNKLKKYYPGQYQWTWFEEPDLDNKITAIAVYEQDFPSSVRKELQKEGLLK